MARKPIKKSDLPCNEPRRTPSHPTKSHVVKACEGGKEKIIRFGQQGVSGSPPRKGESEANKKKASLFQGPPRKEHC